MKVLSNKMAFFTNFYLIFRGYTQIDKSGKTTFQMTESVEKHP